MADSNARIVPKYIPPARRRRQEEGKQEANQDKEVDSRSFQSSRRGSRFGEGRGRRDQNYANHETNHESRPNSRWSVLEDSETSQPDSQERGGRGRGGRGGRGGGRGGNPRENGAWSGSLYSDPRLEAELFSSSGQNLVVDFEKFDDIPIETSGENIPEPVLEYDVGLLGQELMENVRRANFQRPTPVQKYSIPIGLEKRDLMACAQTGSGKTVGFLFPILMQMLRDGPPTLPADARRSYNRKVYPVSLILAPTRELSIQIYDEARKFCYLTGVSPAVVYGGSEVREQIYKIERGCDLLVATPGRLVDLIDRGRISLACVSYLVLDEADRMLDMGFEPQIRQIVQERDMPQEGRQTSMFSATFPREIQQLAADFLNDYIFLAVGRVGAAATDIRQRVEWVDDADKRSALMTLLNQITDGLILVFVETKRSADALENLLIREGYPAVSIHGDRTQRDREYALLQFKEGRCPILVATDVASRGLDIPNVTLVVNFDLPNNIDDYVHRIGRTGRAGNIGQATAFFCEKNRNIARELYEVLVEGGHEVPSFLQEMLSYQIRTQPRGRGRGGSRFGGRDFRNDYGGRRYEGGRGRYDGGGGRGRYDGGGRGRYDGGGRHETRQTGRNDFQEHTSSDAW